MANRLFLDTAAPLDPKIGERRAENDTGPLKRPGEPAAAWQRAGFVDVCEAMRCIRMEYTAFDDDWAPYVGSIQAPPTWPR